MLIPVQCAGEQGRRDLRGATIEFVVSGGHDEESAEQRSRLVVLIAALVIHLHWHNKWIMGCTQLQ
jgi:hypothetical protein